MKLVLKELGLTDTATEADALAAIGKLKTTAAAPPPPPPGPPATPPPGVAVLAAIAKALGLPDTASAEEVLNAVKAIVASEGGPGQSGMMKAKFADLQGQVTTLKSELAGANRRERVAHFTIQARSWPAISGKPEEIAEELVSLEEKDKSSAEKLVARYADLNQRAIASGLMATKGTSLEGGTGDETPFDKAVSERAAKDGITAQKAFALVRKEKPELYRESRKAELAGAKK